MNKSPARIALEGYFAVKKELDDKHDAGVLDDLYHQIYVAGAQRKLGELSGVARSCLDEAVGFLMVNTSHGTPAGRLAEYDTEAYMDWTKERLIINLEPTALRVLELCEAIIDVPVPDPDPKKVEALEAARNHSLSVSKRVGAHPYKTELRAAAKDLHVYNKPPANLIYHTGVPTYAAGKASEPDPYEVLARIDHTRSIAGKPMHYLDTLKKLEAENND